METVRLTSVHVLGLACLGVFIGLRIKRHIPILDRLNIPGPIIGGLLYATILLILRDRWLNVELDLSLSSLFMVAFFTTIGMGASLSLIRRGGVQVLLFFGVAIVGALLQNGLGIGLAKLLGISPLLGIVSGSVALTGGPATALAFGKTFEDMGVAGATAVGVAAAMVGITAGGLLGGFLGGRVISRRNLRSGSKANLTANALIDQAVYAGEPSGPVATPVHNDTESEEDAFLANVVAVGLAMGVGSLISAAMEKAGAVLPAYVGAMIAAAVIRNLDEKFQFLNIRQHQIDAIGNAALQVFIVMALLGMQLWKLTDLALPLIVMLAAQILLVALMATVMVFYSMGKDYDAAVMSGGFCGFMLGTTANAMACMDVLVKKHGPAPRAFIVVPIVGAFLIDFANAMIVTGLANFFK